MGLVDVRDTLNVRIGRKSLSIGSVVMFVVAHQGVLGFASTIAENRSTRDTERSPPSNESELAGSLTIGDNDLREQRSTLFSHWTSD